MRISGTYFDRLLFNILPLVLAVGSIFYFKDDQDIRAFLHISLGLSGLLWILDTIILAFKKPKPLYVREKIFIGQKRIDLENIVRITPKNDKGPKWDFRTIEFEITNCGKIEKYRVLPKPIFFIWDLMGHKSKTLKILIEKFPELRNKLSEEEIE